MADAPEKPPTINPGEKIPVSIEEEIRRSYLDYAMSVIVGRALPDVRDGLKPVHRRVLYGMWEQGNRAGRPYKKSARIVGDVMGKYHPHGDAAIYDTIVRMAQPFSLREPLVDGQGNFGSVDGDAAAAMRYTEIRLARLAEDLIGDDIDKETVDWTLNYDGSLQEPVVLPSAFPNLLVNGSEGIAVGMATKIPPHNLAEACDAAVLLLDDASTDLAALLKVLPGPDFPTGGIILGRQGIVDAYRTGRGILQVRGKAEIEKNKKGDRESIVITEIPFQVNKARLIELIAHLVNEKRLEGISAIRDESDREGMRIVVDVKRGDVAQVVLNQLLALTPLQSSFGIIFLAIVDGQPRVLPLKDLFRHFLDHRRSVVVRRTQFDLRKAEERAHILLGLAVALANLDRVIAIIRAQQGCRAGPGAAVRGGDRREGGAREVSRRRRPSRSRRPRGPRTGSSASTACRRRRSSTCVSSASRASSARRSSRSIARSSPLSRTSRTSSRRARASPRSSGPGSST